MYRTLNEFKRPHRMSINVCSFDSVLQTLCPDDANWFIHKVRSFLRRITCSSSTFHSSPCCFKILCFFHSLKFEIGFFFAFFLDASLLTLSRNCPFVRWIRDNFLHESSLWYSVPLWKITLMNSPKIICFNKHVNKEFTGYGKPKLFATDFCSPCLLKNGKPIEHTNLSLSCLHLGDEA